MRRLGRKPFILIDQVGPHSWSVHVLIHQNSPHNHLKYGLGINFHSGRSQKWNCQACAELPTSKVSNGKKNPHYQIRLVWDFKTTELDLCRLRVMLARKPAKTYISLAQVWLLSFCSFVNYLLPIFTVFLRLRWIFTVFLRRIWCRRQSTVGTRTAPDQTGWYRWRKISCRSRPKRCFPRRQSFRWEKSFFFCGRKRGVKCG